MKRSSPGAAVQQANNCLLFSLQVPPEVRSMHWWSRCRVGAEWLVGRNGSEDPPSLQDNIDCAEFLKLEAIYSGRGLEPVLRFQSILGWDESSLYCRNSPKLLFHGSSPSPDPHLFPQSTAAFSGLHRVHV